MAQRPPITTMHQLLEALYCESFGSRKTLGVVHYRPESRCEVIEHFDSGAGSSSAFDADYSELSVAVFSNAKRRHYIRGALKPGYVSESEFLLTDEGSQALFALRHEAEKEEEQEMRLAEAD